MKVENLLKKILICFLTVFCFGNLNALAIKELPKLQHETEYYKELRSKYRGVTSDEVIMDALEILPNTLGAYSYKAIMGDNLTGKKIKIELKDLNEISPQYKDFDALGWKKSGRLFIYINKKHEDAPPEALAALLGHEALHQDEFNSINEEIYAWTYEAAIFHQLAKRDESITQIEHPLIVRVNTLRKLFMKGNYTSQYIQKAVRSNKGYANLPSRSPGFENENL